MIMIKDRRSSKPLRLGRWLLVLARLHLHHRHSSKVRPGLAGCRRGTGRRRTALQALQCIA